MTHSDEETGLSFLMTWKEQLTHDAKKISQHVTIKIAKKNEKFYIFDVD